MKVDLEHIDGPVFQLTTAEAAGLIKGLVDGLKASLEGREHHYYSLPVSGVDATRSANGRSGHFIITGPYSK